jgi:hypothetical protein
MPDNVAHSTSSRISGKGYNTRHPSRGSRSAEKWSRRLRLLDMEEKT